MDVNMLLKAISIGASGFLIYAAISKVNNIHNEVFIVPFALLFSVIHFGLSFFIGGPVRSVLAIFLLSPVISLMKRERFMDTFIYFTISFAAVYILQMFCAFITSFVFVVLLGFPNFDFRMTVISCLMIFVFLPVLMKIKIKIPEPQKSGISGICVFITGIVFVLYSLAKNRSLSIEGTLSALSGIVLCVFGAVFWTKREKTVAFNKLVHKISEEKSMLEYTDLMKTHDILASQVHKDKKSLMSLYKAVDILAKESSDSKTKRKAIKLLSELKELRSDNSDSGNYDIPSTGIIIIDAMLLYMSEVARQKDIDMEIITDQSVSEIVSVISVGQLETLIADLIENAIKAVSECESESKKMSVSILKTNGIYQIVVKDSGIKFNDDTLAKLGCEKITTYSETGGQGIGYMTVFEILKATGASLTIDQSNPIQKSVVIQFDGKARFDIYHNNKYTNSSNLKRNN